MISSKNGECKIHGKRVEIMTDLVSIVRALIENSGLDSDDIEECVNIGCMQEEEINKKMEEIYGFLMSEAGKGMRIAIALDAILEAMNNER